MIGCTDFHVLDTVWKSFCRFLMLRKEEGVCNLRKTKVGSGGLGVAGTSLNTDGYTFSVKGIV